MRRDWNESELRKHLERELGITYVDVEAGMLEISLEGQKPDLYRKGDRMRLGRAVRRRSSMRHVPAAEWLEKFDEYLVSVQNVRSKRRRTNAVVPLKDRLVCYKNRLVEDAFRRCHSTHRLSSVLVDFSSGEAGISVEVRKVWKKYGSRYYKTTAGVTYGIRVPAEWFEWRRRGLVSYRGGLVLAVRHKGADRYELLVTRQSRGYQIVAESKQVRLTEEGWGPVRRAASEESPLSENGINCMEVSA